MCQPRELHVSDAGVWTGLCWGKQRHGLVAGCGGGLVQGHPGLGGRDGAETLAAFFFSAGSQCSLPSSHTCPPHAEQPCSQGWGAGRFVSWCFRKKEQARLCFLRDFFRGGAPGSPPAPITQDRALSCSQEWLPPTPGSVGLRGLEHWDLGTGEDAVGVFSTPALVASLILG